MPDAPNTPRGLRDTIILPSVDLPDTPRGLRDTIILPPVDAPPAPGLAATLPDGRATTPATRVLASTLADDSGAQRLPLAISGMRLGFDDAGRPRHGDLTRFAVHELLGEGANGSVYRVEDRDLQRDVAVKVLPGSAPPAQIAGFLREARIAASIEHPNVAPVYDLSLSGTGQLWYAMKRIDGTSLDQAIDDLRRAGPEARLVALNARVGTIIQVGNALQAAHARGVVHRDVKPANIMLGRFGEVMLVDWGCAGSSADRRVGRVGTPLYMSPEQARGQAASTACDIYALGATLFELLTLRAPLQPRAGRDFWELKGAGHIDPPSADERRRVPRQLLAIALKALSADPARRYETCRDLCLDLEHYQSGQAISACRDTWDEALRRLHHRLGWPLWLGIVACLALLVLAGAMWREQRKGIATWGAPVLVEDFSGEAWRTRFEVIRGGFEVREGQLVTIGDEASLLHCPLRLEGATAIEYDGTILPGARPCDLSLVWSRDVRPDGQGFDRLVEARKVQVGAYSGIYSALIGAHEEHLAFSPFAPQTGRTYRIRVEISGDLLRLLVDGREILRYRDPLPLVGGYFSLYGYFTGKAFDNLAVYSLGSAERQPATAVPDYLVQRGGFTEALPLYARIASDQAGSDLGHEALYRQGLCLWRSGEEERALVVWAPLAGTDRGYDVDLRRCERSFALGDRAGALGVLDHLGTTAAGEQVERLAAVWDSCVRQLLAVRGRPALDDELPAWLELRGRRLGGVSSTHRTLLAALTRLGRLEHAMEVLGAQAWARNLLLAEMGRWDELPVDQDRAGRIAWETGRFDEVAITCGSWFKPYGAWAAIARGRFAEVEAAWPGNAPVREISLAHRDTQAFLAAFPNMVSAYVLRGEFGLLRASPDPWTRRQGHLYAGFAAAGSGDQARAWEHFDQAVAYRAAEGDGRPHIADWVLVPAARELGGDGPALDAACAEIIARHRWTVAQRPWHRAMLLTGRIDDARFLAQPMRRFASAELRLLRAILADRAGDRVAAAQGYRGYLALPSWQRTDLGVAPEAHFAQARLLAIGR